MGQFLMVRDIFETCSYIELSCGHKECTVKNCQLVLAVLVSDQLHITKLPIVTTYVHTRRLAKAFRGFIVYESNEHTLFRTFVYT